MEAVVVIFLVLVLGVGLPITIYGMLRGKMAAVYTGVFVITAAAVVYFLYMVVAFILLYAQGLAL